MFCVIPAFTNLVTEFYEVLVIGISCLPKTTCLPVEDR